MGALAAVGPWHGPAVLWDAQLGSCSLLLDLLFTFMSPNIAGRLCVFVPKCKWYRMSSSIKSRCGFLTRTSPLLRGDNEEMGWGTRQCLQGGEQAEVGHSLEALQRYTQPWCWKRDGTGTRDEPAVCGVWTSCLSAPGNLFDISVIMSMYLAKNMSQYLSFLSMATLALSFIGFCQQCPGVMCCAIFYVTVY